MSELKQLQDMMAEIIRITGNTNAMVEGLKDKVDVVEARIDGLETTVRENHLEIMAELKAFRTDLDYVEQKTNLNERDIYRIKKLITG